MRSPPCGDSAQATASDSSSLKAGRSSGWKCRPSENSIESAIVTSASPPATRLRRSSVSPFFTVVHFSPGIAFERRARLAAWVELRSTTIRRPTRSDGVFGSASSTRYTTYWSMRWNTGPKCTRSCLASLATSPAAATCARLRATAASAAEAELAKESSRRTPRRSAKSRASSYSGPSGPAAPS